MSNSALSGAVDSREFIDLVGNYSNWGGSGVYISSGKCLIVNITAMYALVPIAMGVE